MSKLIQNRNKLATGVIAFMLAAATSSSWASSASLRGKAAARKDINKGVYRELIYGLPGPWNGNYALLLRRRYNVNVQRVAGCTVTERLTEYVRGYDEVSEAAAKRKFGRDIFEEAYREAGDDWQRKMAEESAAPALSSLPPMKD